MLIFSKKHADISKTKWVLVSKGIFSKTTYVCVLTKFQVSSIILTSFSQGVVLTSLPNTTKQTPKKPTQIRVKNERYLE